MSKEKEDPRYLALKDNLNKLSWDQLWDILGTPKEKMIYDEFNYDPLTNRYCPLAVGLGIMAHSDTDCAAKITAQLGGSSRNLHGVPGEFYRDDRAKDIRTVIQDILIERYYG